MTERTQVTARVFIPVGPRSAATYQDSHGAVWLGFKYYKPVTNPSVVDDDDWLSCCNCLRQHVSGYMRKVSGGGVLTICISCVVLGERRKSYGPTSNSPTR